MKNSVWSEYKDKPSFDALTENIDCECLVIGGGIAGILTAFTLQEGGKNVVLVEGKEVCSGKTKNTTAVITAQHDTTYGEYIKMHGKKRAKAYLNANLQAVEKLASLAKNIDCDFQRKPSYMYSMDKNLINEIKYLRELGYNAELVTNTGLPFAVKSAVKYPNMAEFHPLKFLYSLCKQLKIYEKTFIEEIKGNTAYTKEGYSIKFKSAVVATHYPFINRTGLFFMKLSQKRSYVLALENASDVKGTYIDYNTDGFYFRNYKNLLLIGKGDFRTGTKTDAHKQLEAFASRFYTNAKIKYFWANQDCVSLDDIPYVGKYGNLKNVYMLSGFNLWGMTNSMACAQIVADMIIGKNNEFAFAFSPKRSILRKKLFQNVAVTTYNMLKPTVKRCPHLGCALIYNKKEHSWDCQCHGSRFSKNGTLIDNPATTDADV